MFFNNFIICHLLNLYYDMFTITYFSSAEPTKYILILFVSCYILPHSSFAKCNHTQISEQASNWLCFHIKAVAALAVYHRHEWNICMQWCPVLLVRNLISGFIFWALFSTEKDNSSLSLRSFLDTSAHLILEPHWFEVSHYWSSPLLHFAFKYSHFGTVFIKSLKQKRN
jgi:hypothetical protein